MSDTSVRGRDQFSSRPQLFMVRVWLESLGDGQTEWRGKVQWVATGEAQYFRDWETLIRCLREWLSRAEQQPSTREE